MAFLTMEDSRCGRGQRNSTCLQDFLLLTPPPSMTPNGSRHHASSRTCFDSLHESPLRDRRVLVLGDDRFTLGIADEAAQVLAVATAAIDALVRAS